MIFESQLKKLLSRIRTLEALTEGVLAETSMLRRELPSVARCNSPKGLTDAQIARVEAKRLKSRLRKVNRSK